LVRNSIDLQRRAL